MNISLMKYISSALKINNLCTFIICLFILMDYQIGSFPKISMETWNLCSKGFIVESIPGHYFLEFSSEFLRTRFIISCFSVNLIKELLQSLSFIKAYLLYFLLMYTFSAASSLSFQLSAKKADCLSVNLVTATLVADLTKFIIIIYYEGQLNY